MDKNEDQDQPVATIISGDDVMKIGEQWEEIANKYARLACEEAHEFAKSINPDAPRPLVVMMLSFSLCGPVSMVTTVPSIEGVAHLLEHVADEDHYSQEVGRPEEEIQRDSAIVIQFPTPINNTKH